MANQGVVVSRANEDTPAIGGLFKDISFFITQRVPMRSSFLDRVKANGGRIVKLEAAATYIIADHVRLDCPPNSLSYTFIETAIRTGALPDANRHRAGPAPGFVRPVGSTIVPRKATRTEFTAQDDRDLWTWVQQCVQKGVHSVKGLEMYKQLEAVNPRHTTQSWRDRYLKKLVHNPPQGVTVPPGSVVVPPAPAPKLYRTVVNGVIIDPRKTPAANGPTQETEETEQPEEEEEEEDEEEEDLGDAKEDFDFLMQNIDDILCVPEEDKDPMWGMLAEQPASQHRNAGEWRSLYEDKVLPAYEKKQQKGKKAALPSPSKNQPRPSTPEAPRADVELTTPEMVAMKAKAARERDPSPSSTAQKRKRKTATPRSTYGRKRTKAGHSELFTDDSPAEGPSKHKETEPAPKAKNRDATSGVRVQAPDPAESRPVDNQQHVIQSHDAPDDPEQEGLYEAALPDGETIITSEANRAAKAQLIAEANLADADLESRVLDHLTEVDTTVPADTAASNHDDELSVEETNITLEEATPKQSKRPAPEDGFPEDIQSQVEVDMFNNVVTGAGSRLIARNLTEQQAGTNGRPTRATDLPADDDEVSHYAEYLQGLVNATTHRLVNDPSEGVPQHLIDAHLERERRAAVARANDGPDSGRETIPEPTQMQQDHGADGASRINGGESNGDLTEGQITRAQELSRSVQGLFAPSIGHSDSANNDKDGAENSDEDMDGEIDIDLTLAEPEGGFGFRSQDEPAEQQPDQHEWEQSQPQQPPRSQPQAGAQIEISSDSGEGEGDDDDDDMEEGPATTTTPKPQALDTQAIYDAGTQHPDLSFPLPPDSNPPVSEPDLPTDPVVPAPAAQKPAPKPGALKRPSAAKRKSSAPSVPSRSQPAAPQSETMQSFLQRFTAKGCSPQSLRDALYRTSGNIEVAELVVMAERFSMPVPDLPAIWSDADDALVGATNAAVVNGLMQRKGWEEYEVRINFLQDWRGQK